MAVSRNQLLSRMPRIRYTCQSDVTLQIGQGHASSRLSKVLHRGTFSPNIEMLHVVRAELCCTEGQVDWRTFQTLNMLRSTLITTFNDIKQRLYLNQANVIEVDIVWSTLNVIVVRIDVMELKVAQLSTRVSDMENKLQFVCISVNKLITSQT